MRYDFRFQVNKFCFGFTDKISTLGLWCSDHKGLLHILQSLSFKEHSAEDTFSRKDTQSWQQALWMHVILSPTKEYLSNRDRSVWQIRGQVFPIRLVPLYMVKTWIWRKWLFLQDRSSSSLQVNTFLFWPTASGSVLKFSLFSPPTDLFTHELWISIHDVLYWQSVKTGTFETELPSPPISTGGPVEPASSTQCLVGTGKIIQSADFRNRYCTRLVLGYMRCQGKYALPRVKYDIPWSQ